MMNKRVNKKKIIELYPYWKDMEIINTEYIQRINKLQTQMQEKCKNKNLEFFWVDGEIVGIGTPRFPKKMNLIHDTSFFNYECEKK